MRGARRVDPLEDVLAAAHPHGPRADLGRNLDLVHRYFLASLLTIEARRLPIAGERISTVSPGFR